VGGGVVAKALVGRTAPPPVTVVEMSVTIMVVVVPVEPGGRTQPREPAQTRSVGQQPPDRSAGHACNRLPQELVVCKFVEVVVVTIVIVCFVDEGAAVVTVRI